MRVCFRRRPPEQLDPHSTTPNPTPQVIEDLQGRHQDHESEINSKQDELRNKQEEIDTLREGTTSGSEYEPENDDAQDEDKVGGSRH